MWRFPRTNSFAALIISALALAGCSRSSPVIQTSTPPESMKVQVTKGQSTSDWKINILEVAEPDTVKIQSQLSTSDEKPDQNKKWLMLTLDLTPPSANASLPIKQIKLVDESSVTQTPLSLTSKAEADAPRFKYFEDSFGPNMLGVNQAGLGSVDKEGKMVWMYTRDKKTNEVVLIVMKAEPQKILFLFAVPATARKLTLQL
jgi:hypothetical protein